MSNSPVGAEYASPALHMQRTAYFLAAADAATFFKDQVEKTLFVCLAPKNMIVAAYTARALHMHCRPQCLIEKTDYILIKYIDSQ